MTENMQKYLELVGKDEALKQKMEALKNKDAKGLLEGTMTLAKEHGIELTEADFVFKAPDGELSDDELEAAAGGCMMCEWSRCFDTNQAPRRDGGQSDEARGIRAGLPR